MNDIPTPDYAALYALASAQSGYFTTTQAKEHGVSWRALTHHAAGGRFQRDTHPLPATLPAPPTAWMVPYRKIAGEVGLASDIAAGHAWAAAFLDSIILAPTALMVSPPSWRAAPWDFCSRDVTIGLIPPRLQKTLRHPPCVGPGAPGAGRR